MIREELPFDIFDTFLKSLKINEKQKIPLSCFIIRTLFEIDFSKIPFICNDLEKIIEKCKEK